MQKRGSVCKAENFGHRKCKMRSSANGSLSCIYPLQFNISIYRGVAQFGSFEHERFLRKIKRVRKVAAVKILLRSKELKILGTASVRCVAARTVPCLVYIPYNLIFLFIEVWLSLVERCVRDAEAAGSSPVTSTIFYLNEGIAQLVRVPA